MATSLIQHVDILNSKFSSIFPTHLTHKHSESAGKKTEQVWNLSQEWDMQTTEYVIKKKKKCELKKHDDLGICLQFLFVFNI